MSNALKETLDATMAARSDVKAKFELLTNNTKVQSVKGNLPLSLMPDSLNNHGREIVDLLPDGPGIFGFEVARRGLKDLYEALSDVDEAHAALLKPTQVGTVANTGQPIIQMQVPPERAAEFEQALNNRNARATQTVKRTVDVIDQSIAQLDTQLAQSVVHPRANAQTTIQEQAEIRSYIRTELKPEARMNFLHQACERKDLAVVSAVLSVSPWACHLTPEQHAQVRDLAHQSFAPREYKHATALRKIRGHYFEAIDTYAKEVAKRRPMVPLATPGSAALQRLKGTK